jgi:hypothetical protein
MIANAVFGFPKGSKFLKFVIEALALSFALQPRHARVLFCNNRLKFLPSDCFNRRIVVLWLIS